VIGRLLVALLILGPAALAAAQTAPARCDLEACLRVAYANHPILKSGEAQQAEANALVRLRKAERMPLVTADGATGYFDGETVGPQAALRGLTQRSVSGWYWEVGPSFEVPIFSEGAFIGQPAAAVRQAEFGVSEKQWKLRSLRIEVATRVAEAYLDALKSQAAARTGEEVLTLTETRYRLALEQFNQNLISRADLLMAEVHLASAKRDLAVARAVVDRAQHALRSAMGLDDGAARIEVEAIPDPPEELQLVQVLVARVRETHPEVKSQEFKVLQSREEVKRAESERWPTLSVNAAYRYADDFDPSGPSQFVAALRLKIPIFDFGRITEKVAAAQARLQDQEGQLQDVKLRVGQDVGSFYYQVREAEAKIALTRAQIEQAAEAVKLNRSLFEQGLLSGAALNESQATLLKLRLSLAGFEGERALARFRLKLLSEG